MRTGTDIAPHIERLMETAPAGFALGLHVRYTTPTYMFQTYPRPWLEEYSREGFLMQDPTVAWAFGNEGHVTWAELAPQDEAGVLGRAAAMGLRHGVAMSVVRDGSRSIGGFARSDRPFTAAEIARVESSMVHLHDVTASVQPLPEEVRDELRRLSVAFTHP
jgi:LuxR family transcriptional regulator